MRICDVGAIRPGPLRAASFSSFGRREGAEPLEEPLDHVHLRLRERRVEPHASHASRRDAPPLRSRGSARRGSRTCCRATTRRAPDASAFSSSSASARSVPPRSSRLSRTWPRALYVLRDTALPGAGDPHHEHDLGRVAAVGRGGADRARRNRDAPARRRRARASRRARPSVRSPAGGRPGLRSTFGPRPSSHASATSAGVESCASATSRSTCAAGEARRAARPAERRVGDQRDTRLGASLDQADAERPVVDHAQGNLHRGDRSEPERLVQLTPVDVREADARHQTVLDEPGERAHRRPPRRSRVGSVEEVEVDREPVERLEARLAVRADRLRAAVGDPGALPVAPCRPSSRSAQSRRRHTHAVHGRAAARCGRAPPLRARTHARCRTR